MLDLVIKEMELRLKYIEMLEKWVLECLKSILSMAIQLS
jgi:hypothetical protein